MQFDNISIIKKANIYYDGRVTSRTILLRDGTKKTLGIMLPGEYEFSTGVAEIMEIISGSMNVLLPDASSYQSFKAGDMFEVSGGSSFKLIINEVTDYCCSYEDGK